MERIHFFERIPVPELQALGQILKDIEARIEEEELEVPIPEEELTRDPQVMSPLISDANTRAYELGFG